MNFKTFTTLSLITIFLLGCSKSNPTTPPATYKVGQSAFGGIIFYIDATNLHGLVVTSSDLPPASNIGTSWGCYLTSIPGALGTAVGTGKENTDAIIAACPSTNIAAYKCHYLNSGGFADWYLPSIGELNLIANNNSVFGLTAGYWSSSNDHDNFAFVWNFSSGHQTENDKNGQNKVRAIRNF